MNSPSKHSHDAFQLQVPWPNAMAQFGFYNSMISPNPHIRHQYDYFEVVGKTITHGDEAEAISMIKKTDLITRNFLHLTVKYDPKVTEMIDSPAMTFVRFMGGASGILNLWSGITFIALVELIDLLINVVWGWVFRENKTKVNQVTVKENHSLSN